MIDVAYPYFDVNLSWLSNNYRLLLEAADESVPLRERIRCLGNYAYQTAEFYRLRIPKLLAMCEVSSDIRTKLNIFPQSLLGHIYETIDNQLIELQDLVRTSIVPALFENGVVLNYQENLLVEHAEYSRNYIIENVFRHLQPVFLDSRRSAKLALFESKKLYLIIRLQDIRTGEEELYASLNVPVQLVGRFVELPEVDGSRYLAFLEDILKENMDLIFPGYDILDCYTLTVEKDTEFNIEDEYPTLLVSRILKQLDKRGFAQPIQYFCETGMPASMIDYLSEKTGNPLHDFHNGGNYLLLNDLQKFPAIARKAEYPIQKPISASGFPQEVSIFDAILAGDQLLHLPYHSYEPVMRFFNEAAVDPNVKEIHVSLYKISYNSFILNSLISAARNGKRVHTYVELNTKLDAHENLQWARRMRDAGVKIFFSEPGLKVHAKIALVKRRGMTGWERFAFLGTGGFFRLTSREIVDHALFTCQRELTNEIELLFGYLFTQDEPKKYKYLPFNTISVTQFNLQKRLIELIDREISNCNAGLRAYITIKINQIQDKILIDKLYQAGQAGVPVHVIASESSSILSGLPSFSENIIVSRYIDRYMENTRIFNFCNRGADEIYLSSCDWTFRNLHRRIDICYPILDENIKGQMKAVLRNYLSDNQKVVRLDLYQNNLKVVHEEGKPKVRAQDANLKLVEKWEKGAAAKKNE